MRSCFSGSSVLIAAFDVLPRRDGGHAWRNIFCSAGRLPNHRPNGVFGSQNFGLEHLAKLQTLSLGLDDKIVVLG
jgi:hypothetical protein